jgi:hypothetical protein
MAELRGSQCEAQSQSRDRELLFHDAILLIAICFEVLVNLGT